MICEKKKKTVKDKEDETTGWFEKKNRRWDKVWIWERYKRLNKQLNWEDKESEKSNQFEKRCKRWDKWSNW